MTHRVLVLPHGCGIGDFVNLQPLVASVVRARPRADISVLGPPEYTPLLPPGVRVLDRVGGIPYWRRPPMTTPVHRLAGHVSGRVLAPLMPLVPLRAVTSGLGQYARLQDFDEVVNLLDALVRLDVADRWTPGPWNEERRHVIDLLADALEEQGIPVPVEERCPALVVKSPSSGGQATLLINPASGSSLKEVPLATLVEVGHQAPRLGLQPQVLFGPDSRRATALCAAVPDATRMDSPSLPALMEHIAAAGVLLSADTGALHLAAALGTPHVGVFGATDMQFLGPYDRSRGVYVEAAVARPPECGNCWSAQLVPVGRCGAGYGENCLETIPPAEVLRAVAVAYSITAESLQESIR